MNKLEIALYKTRDSLLDYQADPIYNIYSVTELDQCSHCGIWLRKNQFKKDLDQHDICNLCLEFEGM